MNDRSLFYLLRVAGVAVSAKFNRRDRNRVLTASEFLAIDAIASSRGKKPTIADLARCLAIDRISVRQTLKALERRRFVHRELAQGRRSQPLSLTAEGWRAHAVARRWYSTTERSLRRELGKKDADELVRLLGRLGGLSRPERNPSDR